MCMLRHHFCANLLRAVTGNLCTNIVTGSKELEPK